MRMGLPQSISWKFTLLMLLSAMATASVRGTNTTGAWSPLYKGVQYATGYSDGPHTQRVYAIQIDLQAPGISVSTTPKSGSCSETLSQQTSRFLAASGAKVAINAGFFTPCCATTSECKTVSGLAISQGQLVSAAVSSGTGSAILRIGTNNAASFDLTTNNVYDTTGIVTAIGGDVLLLTNGLYAVDPGYAPATTVDARTAVGLSQNNRYLILLVIDGDQPGWSDGATYAETANWLTLFGAWNGLDLDGGGASTMAGSDNRGGALVLNRPIDGGIPGQQQFVANQLVVFANPLSGQPVSQTVCPGSSASFTITATGPSLLTYMWRKLNAGWGSGNQWTFSPATCTGSNGFYVGDSRACQPGGVDPGIDTAGQAFGVYANSGASAEVTRDFPALAAGQSVSIAYQNPASMSSAGAGTEALFSLRDASGNARFEFYFNGGDSDYSINDSSPLQNNSGIGFTSGGLQLVFTLAGADVYNLNVTRLQDGQVFPFQGRMLTGNSGSAITQLRLYYRNSGAGGTACQDFFFNNVTVNCLYDDASDYSSAGACAGTWLNGSNLGAGVLTNGGNIAGADTATLQISGAGGADAGSYDVCVLSSCGTMTSSPATLTVQPLCLNVLTPADESVTTSATVSVTGTALSTSTVFSVAVNAASAASTNGYASWQAAVSALTGGTNVLTTVATDSAGNTATNISHVIYADATFDGNGDGIPDSWQIRYFGSPGASNACASCDADGTGQNNLFKYVAGLDPTNPASVFVLGIAGVANVPAVSFSPVVSNRTYTVQFTTNMTGAVWAPLVGYGGPTTNGSRVTITDPTATPPDRFYRISISTP